MSHRPIDAQLAAALAAFGFTSTGSIEIDEGIVYGRRADGEERHFIAHAKNNTVGLACGAWFDDHTFPGERPRNVYFMMASPDAASRTAYAARARAVAYAAEVNALIAALDTHAGNQVAAAGAIGISLATLKRRLVTAGYTAETLRERWPLSGRQPQR